MEATQIVALLAGLVGMLAHFWKKKLRKQTVAGLKNYIKTHPTYTIAALAATLVGAGALAPAAVDWGNIAGAIQAYTPAFLVGYTVDSAINKAVDES